MGRGFPLKWSEVSRLKKGPSRPGRVMGRDDSEPLIHQRLTPNMTNKNVSMADFGKCEVLVKFVNEIKVEAIISQLQICIVLKEYA